MPFRANELILSTERSKTHCGQVKSDFGPFFDQGLDAKLPANWENLGMAGLPSLINDIEHVMFICFFPCHQYGPDGTVSDYNLRGSVVRKAGNDDGIRWETTRNRTVYLWKRPNNPNNL